MVKEIEPSLFFYGTVVCTIHEGNLLPWSMERGNDSQLSSNEPCKLELKPIGLTARSILETNANFTFPNWLSAHFMNTRATVTIAQGKLTFNRIPERSLGIISFLNKARTCVSHGPRHTGSRTSTSMMKL